MERFSLFKKKPTLQEGVGAVEQVRSGEEVREQVLRPTIAFLGWSPDFSPLARVVDTADSDPVAAINNRVDAILFERINGLLTNGSKADYDAVTKELSASDRERYDALAERAREVDALYKSAWQDDSLKKQEEALNAWGKAYNEYTHDATDMMRTVGGVATLSRKDYEAYLTLPENTAVRAQAVNHFSESLKNPQYLNASELSNLMQSSYFRETPPDVLKEGYKKLSSTLSWFNNLGARKQRDGESGKEYAERQQKNEKLKELKQVLKTTLKENTPEEPAAESQTAPEGAPARTRLKEFFARKYEQIEAFFAEDKGVKGDAEEMGQEPTLDPDAVAPVEAPVDPEAKNQALKRILENIKGLPDKYNALPPKTKLLVGAGLLAAGLAGAALSSGAILGGVAAVKYGLRAVSAYGAGKGVEQMMIAKGKEENASKAKWATALGVFALGSYSGDIGRSLFEHIPESVKDWATNLSLHGHSGVAHAAVEHRSASGVVGAADVTHTPDTAVDSHHTTYTPDDAAPGEINTPDTHGPDVAYTEDTWNTYTVEDSDTLSGSMRESFGHLDSGFNELTEKGKENLIANTLANLSSEQLKEMGVSSGNPDLIFAGDEINMEKLLQFAKETKVTVGGHEMSLLERAKLL